MIMSMIQFKDYNLKKKKKGIPVYNSPRGGQAFFACDVRHLTV